MANQYYQNPYTKQQQVTHGSTHVSTGGMVDILSKYFYTQNFENSAKEFVRTCMICQKTGRPWPECIGLVKMWMRLTQSSQKLTPFEIIHGRPFPLPITSEPIDKSIEKLH